MVEKTERTSSTLSSPWTFFVLVICWTWAFWILAAAAGTSAQSGPGMALVVAGLLGPMLGGIGFTYATQDREGWREYWSRVIDPRRIPARWFPVIFLFAPCLMAAAVLIDIALDDTSTLAQIGNRVGPLFTTPLAVVPFLLRVLIYGPFPEELGWRGYVLDRLQARWSALASSLILGAVWALWHLPLFFIRDMNPHHSHGAWSLWFWLFMAEVVAMGIIYTWIFNNTRRSTLAAMIFHFMGNLAAELANVTAGTNLYSTVLWIAAAVAIAVWGAGTFTRLHPASG